MPQRQEPVKRADVGSELDAILDDEARKNESSNYQSAVKALCVPESRMYLRTSVAL